MSGLGVSGVGGVSSMGVGTFSAVLYGCLSLLMVLLNKLVITKFFFDYPMVIMMLQMAVALFSMEFVRMIGILKIPPYTFDRGKDMLLPSLVYCLHSYFSLTALEGMSLPMYGAIKRCVPLINLYLAVVFLKKPYPSKGIMGSVLLITGGAFMASLYDFMFDMWSYLYGGLSIIFQAVYLTLIERLALTTQYGTLEMVYMNSFNGLVFFLIADMVQDEIRDAFMYFITSASVLFWFTFVALLIVGALLNFALFLCTVNNSAVVTSLVGNVKAVFQTVIGYFLGMFIFFDVVPSAFNIFGILINLVGCVGYSYVRNREAKVSGGYIKGLDLNSNRL